MKVTMTILPFRSNLEMIRAHIAHEENISDERALICYSDSKLMAVELADPVLFESWQNTALEAFNQLVLKPEQVTRE